MDNVLVPLWLIVVLIVFSTLNAAIHGFKFIASHKANKPMTLASIEGWATHEIVAINDARKKLTLKRAVQLISVACTLGALVLLAIHAIETETGLLLLAMPLPLSTLVI